MFVDLSSITHVEIDSQGDWRKATQAEANGLVSGHAYTITKVMRVSIPNTYFK
jgi:hypothetical protein